MDVPADWRPGDCAPRECKGDADDLEFRGAKMVADGIDGGLRGALAAAALLTVRKAVDMIARKAYLHFRRRARRVVEQQHLQTMTPN